MPRIATIALVALLACSCGGPIAGIPSTASAQHDARPTPAPTPTLPATLPPGTPPPQVLSPTPTYDFRTAATITPPPEAKCPPEAGAPPLNLGPVFEQDPLLPPILDPILEYLNSGGDPTLIAEQLWDGDVHLRDVTGDGVSEVLMYVVDFYVLACMNGEYEVVYKVPGELGLPFNVLSISDMNLDQLPEIVLVKPFCFNAPCYKVRILEFDGVSFVDLIYNTNPYWERTAPGTTAEVQYGSVAAMDLDLNGTVELLVDHAETPAYLDQECWIPDLSSRDVFMWNGAAFVPTDPIIAPPRYRFQAVQYGDFLYSIGEYKEAISSYLKASTEETLDWWSAERRDYLIRLVSQWAPGPTPQPPQPDPMESSALAAYSGFRTMLAYAAMAQDEEALAAYNRLTARAAAASAGYPFVQMAAEFWSGYSNGRDIQSACQRAIEFAQSHPDQTLSYFGPERLGCWEYDPQDLCPAPGGGLTTR